MTIILFHYRIKGGSPVCTSAVTVDIRGLDIHAISQAFERVSHDAQIYII